MMMNKLTIMTALLLLLTACGGGTELPDDQLRSTHPVDCKAKPEACK